MQKHQRQVINTESLACIGIQGGTCAGKTTLARALASRFSEQDTMVVCLDDFFRPFDRKAHAGNPIAHNFDDPGAVDWNLLKTVLHDLREEGSAEMPIFDYVTGLRQMGPQCKAKRFLVVEGLWAFHDPEISAHMDLKVFVDTPDDIRLTRRLLRDVLQGSRGWTVSSALTYYLHCTRPIHEKLASVGKQYADVIISGETDVNCNVDSLMKMLSTIKGGMVRRDSVPRTCLSDQ
jgi:uridine kinase